MFAEGETTLYCVTRLEMSNPVVTCNARVCVCLHYYVYSTEQTCVQEIIENLLEMFLVTNNC